MQPSLKEQTLFKEAKPWQHPAFPPLFEISPGSTGDAALPGKLSKSSLQGKRLTEASKYCCFGCCFFFHRSPKQALFQGKRSQEERAGRQPALKVAAVQTPARSPLAPAQPRKQPGHGFVNTALCPAPRGRRDLAPDFNERQ